MATDPMHEERVESYIAEHAPARGSRKLEASAQAAIAPPADPDFAPLDIAIARFEKLSVHHRFRAKHEQNYFEAETSDAFAQAMSGAARFMRSLKMRPWQPGTHIMVVKQGHPAVGNVCIVHEPEVGGRVKVRVEKATSRIDVDDVFDLDATDDVAVPLT